jgi:branched-subunit amino acid ABC-type transport system permease component
MSNFVLYLLLGLGSGAAYALLANGIVTTYKGSGILNFAQGAIAMFAAYCYLALLRGGLPRGVALVITLIGAAIGGALLAVTVVRPLRNAPVLAKVVATLGIFTGLQGLASLIWGSETQLVPSLFPQNSVTLFSGTHLGVDRLYMLVAAFVIAAILWAGFRFTRLGLGTQAASENERGAALLGFSPVAIAATNWALGAVLAALAGIMIAPLTGVDEQQLPLIVFPAMAAALVGGFSSFWVTTATAVAIGMVQSELLNIWSQQGVETAAPFILVIAVMVVLGRGLPTRGTVSQGRPPTAAAGRVRPLVLVGAVVVAVVLLSNFNATYQGAMATSLAFAVMALSLVVVTGYVGQVSLMQMTFAGLGGFITAKMAYNLGIPFPFSIIVAALIAVPIGAALGMPALRVRGMSLAVVTLGAAVAIDAIVFQNESWAGGSNGVQIPSPSIAGFSLDPFLHPMRFGCMCLVGLIVMALLVSNVRRSALGRRMLAVRSNERASAVAGVNVRAVKLQAFMLASAIAAVGGGLLAYSNPYFELGTGQFAAVPAITLLTIAYIGGIASISGAVLAGLISSGGVLYVALSGISGFDNWYVLASGVGLLWTVLQQPDGVAVYNQRLLAAGMAKLGALRGRPATVPDAESDDAGNGESDSTDVSSSTEMGVRS